MRALLISLILLPFTSLVAQHTYVDSAPRGLENVRVYEGGAVEVLIDCQTPLSQLIKRLEGDWEFVETGKAYWIGYTDDMYSIAARKEDAIEPLLNFIKTTQSERAQVGAALTLHLIGIESKIVGRFVENFTNEKARLALLSLLTNENLHELTMDLLSRDPWASDFPYFMNYLSDSSKPFSNLLSIMQRYDVPDHPFTEKIPASIGDIEVSIHTDKLYSRNPIPDLLALKAALGEKLIIDKEILNSELWNRRTQQLKDNALFKEQHSFQLILEMLTNSNAMFSYGEINNLFYYTYCNDVVTIYGKYRARDIWLQWWANLLPEEIQYIDCWRKMEHAFEL